jgi:radical SAM superfamily enzyme YgiQ (UPF0313 family)
MKVLFLNPPAGKRKIMRNFDCATESKGTYLLQPYDFVLLSGSLPPSWHIDFIDAIAENYSENDVLDILEKTQYDLLIYALADTNWRDDLAFLKKITSNNLCSMSWVFGDVFIEESRVKEVKDFCDKIIISPLYLDLSQVENSSIEEIKNNKELPGFHGVHFFKGKKLKAPQYKEINQPRHELFLHKAYRWPFAKYKKYTTVFTAWGCPYSCDYCIVSSFPFLIRQASAVLEELDTLHKSGLKEIFMGDRSFGLPLNNIKEILQEMIRRDYKFSWSTFIHPNQFDEKLFDLMRDSGCHTILTGVESHDFSALKSNGRHTNASKITKMFDYCRKNKIKVCGDFMLGMPGESEESILKTIKYSKEIKIDFASFNIAAPLSGTSIRRNAIEQGYLKENEWGFDSSGEKGVLPNGVLTGERILELKKKAVMSYYFRPTYLIKKLFHVKSFEQFLIQLEQMWGLFSRNIFKS